MRTNSWLDRRVIPYAHQGGAKESPSSTLGTIERAIGLGATAIELDVHATSDRTIVVCHDPTLDRTTERTGEIRNFTWAELQERDNAYWFVPGEDAQPGRSDDSYPLRGRGPADHDYGIASLAEILERFPGVVLNLDIKRTAPEVEPYEDVLAEVLRFFGRTGEDVIVASFNDEATAAFSRCAPEFSTSAGTIATAEFYGSVRSGTAPPESVLRHVALQVPHKYEDITVVGEAFVEAAHRAGIAVHVWTIDERTEMEELLDLGVDGIISDMPTVMMDLFEERGVTWKP